MSWPGSFALKPDSIEQAFVNLLCSAPNISYLVYHDKQNGGDSEFTNYIIDSLDRGQLPIEIALYDHNDDDLNNIKLNIALNLKDRFIPGNIEVLNEPLTEESIDALPEDIDYLLVLKPDPDNIPRVSFEKDVIYTLSGIITSNCSSPDAGKFIAFSFHNKQNYCYKDNKCIIMEMGIEEIITEYYTITIALIYTCYLNCHFPMIKETKTKKKRTLIERWRLAPGPPLLESELKIGQQFSLHQLKLTIDKISRKENKKLVSVSDNPFRYVCKSENCHAVVRGRVADNIITITKVTNHSENCNSVYKPNKAARFEDSAHIDIHNSIKHSLSDFITKGETSKTTGYSYSISTFAKMRDAQKQTSKSIIDNEWKQIKSLVHLFSNDTNSNTLFETNQTASGEEIKRFFILPQESIDFMNSKLFMGLVVIDGTFLKFYKIGTLIILATYLGTHKIISLAWGYCGTENSSDIIPFLKVVKQNFNDEKLLKAFMSDGGTAILKSESTVFPDAIKRRCLIHKKSRMDPKSRNLLTKTANAKSVDEFQMFIKDFLEKNEVEPDSIEELNETLKSYSPLYTPAPTQGIATNGACETINSILKGSKNDSIINYIRLLYFKLRTNILDMEKECGEKYTNFVCQKIEQFNNADEAHEIINVVIHDSHHATVTEKIYGKNYRYTVDNEKGLACSCNQEKEMCFGCIHIYYVCRVDPAFGNWDDTVHDGYKTEEIQKFLHNFPPMVSIDHLETDPSIKPPEQNRTKNRRRCPCPIDIIVKYAKGK